jgi:hypothetical protein
MSSRILSFAQKPCRGKTPALKGGEHAAFAEDPEAEQVWRIGRRLRESAPSLVPYGRNFVAFEHAIQGTAIDIEDFSRP